MAGGTWTVVAPVKGGDRAKSRLAPPGPGRTALARAMALDTVAATVAAAPVVADVVVVTEDPAVGRGAAGLGARSMYESRPGEGLLAAVADGLRVAGPGPVAVLLPDLPCLRPDDLRAALRAARQALAGGARAAFVADADGPGTVLLAGLRAEDLRPAFGPDSAAAHERLGAMPLDALDLPRLRRDVDTPDALREAVELGVGPRTAAALRCLQPTSA